MKTSLIIEDSLFREAKRESGRLHKTVSETISEWARIGRETLQKVQRKGRKDRLRLLRTIDLGGAAAMDLNSRRDWMDRLDS